MGIVSLFFFAFYISCVIVLHRELKPLSETARLIRELLPERWDSRTSPVAVDTYISEDISGGSADVKFQLDLAVVPENAGTKLLS